MNEKSNFDSIGSYVDQAAEYAAFADGSYTWQYIERPAFDEYLSDLYQPDKTVLDIGCGTGRVVQHLTNQGMSAKNIVGVEPVLSLLNLAQEKVPDALFIQGNATELSFKHGVFDLVTSNMVFHHLDRIELLESFNAIYNVLKIGGTLFFVDTDPDHSRRHPNQWVEQRAPWGSVTPAFNHDMYEMLLDSAYYAGFDVVGGRTLSVAQEGAIDAEKYAHYSGKPARLAARLSGVSPEEKAERIKHMHDTVPVL